MIFEGTKKSIFFGLGLTRAGKSYPELQMLEGDDQPFCDIYGATSSSVLMEYLSPEEI